MKVLPYILKFGIESLKSKDWYLSGINITEEKELIVVEPKKVSVKILNEGQLELDIESYRKKLKNSREYLEFDFKSLIRYRGYVTKNVKTTYGEMEKKEVLDILKRNYNFSGEQNIKGYKFDKNLKPLCLFKTKKEAKEYFLKECTEFISRHKEDKEYDEVILKLEEIKKSI